MFKILIYNVSREKKISNNKIIKNNNSNNKTCKNEGNTDIKSLVVNWFG